MGLMVSEKKIFIVFPIISLWELMTPGAWPVWAPYRGPYKLLASRFREEDFLSFSHNNSMRAYEPGAWPVWTPWA